MTRYPGPSGVPGVAPNHFMDYLVRVIAKDANVRGLACITGDLVRGLCIRHRASPTASAALGRAITGAALMGALLKTGQRLAIKLEGDGPLRKIVVEADSTGAVRGYAAVPEVDLPLRDGKLDVAGALGRTGLLTVTKDLGLKEPYTGVVRLRSGEIAEDLAYYLTESEQIPSALGLGVFVNNQGIVAAAGGFLVQSFPPFDEQTVDHLIGRIQDMPAITDLLRQGKGPEELLKTLFDGISYESIGKREIFFQCACSRERVERAIMTLGREEVIALMQRREGTDVKCEYCLESYHLSLEDLGRMLEEMRGGSNGQKEGPPLH